MDGILSEIKNNRIDYAREIDRAIKYFPNPDAECDIHVIVPVRGRIGFLMPLIWSFRDACDGDLRISITIVEHSHFPEYEKICRNQGVNYVFLHSKKAFNKSLCYNMGVILGNKAKWQICHDLDCLVQGGFFRKVLDNLHNKNTEAVQSYRNRSPLYCDRVITELIIGQRINVNAISIDNGHTFYDKGLAPGGSITLSRELFFRVGGYDPELFTGYSPEDKFFWDKVSTFENIGICNDPAVDVLHLDHVRMQNTNPRLGEMTDLSQIFLSLDNSSKIEILHYKRDLIRQYE
jgi:hypothetical protein